MPEDAAALPAIVVVSRSAAVREQLCTELAGRYARDYAVSAFATADEALDALAFSPDSAASLATGAHLEPGGATVALLIAGLGGEDPDGLEVLRRLSTAFPSALRIPAPRWGDWSTARPIFDALALGQVDRWVTRPEGTPDEEFHRSVTEYLEEWRSRQGDGFQAVRIIGERWSERSQHLRDNFTRNRIPIGFYDSASPAGSAMLSRLDLEDPRLPVVVLRFAQGGQVLQDPTDLDIAVAFGIFEPVDEDERFDLAIVGARDPRAGRRGVRGVRGPVDAGDRAPGRRRPGGHELAHPQLPRFPDGDQRGPPHAGRIPAGLGVRREVPLHAGGDVARRRR